MKNDNYKVKRQKSLRNQESIFIGVNLCLLDPSMEFILSTAERAQDMLIENKHVWKTNPIRRPPAGNTKHEALNPKEFEWVY